MCRKFWTLGNPILGHLGPLHLALGAKLLDGNISLKFLLETRLQSKSGSCWSFGLKSYDLKQPCPTRGPVQAFATVKVSYILTTCPYFDDLEFNIFDQVVLSDTLSCLLPLQLGFQCFQYISLR